MATQTAVSDLYAKSPGVATATPGSATAAKAAGPAPIQSQDATASYAGTRDAAAINGQASGYGATTGEINKDTMTSAGQLADITGQDSPLMRRARSEGLLTAGRRGLNNSSIAAGSAMGAAIDRAAPLAQQDAQAYLQQSLTNQGALNRAAEFNAGETNRMTALNTELGTNVNLANARASDEAAKLNAQLETAVSQGNAQEANRIQTRLAELQTEVGLNNAAAQTNVNLANASAETQTGIQNAASTNEMNANVLNLNQQLNEQFMRGEQANDLATIQGRYQQLISSNETAARLYDSYFQSIGSAMANPDVTPDRIAQYVGVQQDMLDAGLRMMDAINTLDLGNFSLPNVSAAGYGKNTRVTSSPGTAPTGSPTAPNVSGVILNPEPTVGVGLPAGTQPEMVTEPAPTGATAPVAPVSKTPTTTNTYGVPQIGTPEYDQWLAELRQRIGQIRF